MSLSDITCPSTSLINKQLHMELFMYFLCNCLRNTKIILRNSGMGQAFSSAISKNCCFSDRLKYLMAKSIYLHKQIIHLLLPQFLHVYDLQYSV